MDVNNKDLTDEIEQANFVMLSLYREYSKRLLKGENVEFNRKQMALIRNDMMYLDKPQIICKAQQIYVPILKKMLKEQGAN